MIGNDIVDLKFASIESNWKRNGFLDKIFTKEEQQYISETKKPFEMVWLLWSMKESTYKVYVQQYLKRFFSPKKLSCFLTSSTSGYVRIDGKAYPTTSSINNRYIYTEAVLKTSENIKNHCFFIEDNSVKNQRKVAYEQLKTTISKANQLSFEDLEIKKTVLGIPKVYQKEQCLDIPFSITHHGNYGAISILN